MVIRGDKGSGEKVLGDRMPLVFFRGVLTLLPSAFMLGVRLRTDGISN